MGVEKLKVTIELNGIEIELGELLAEGRNIYFKYYPDFVDTGLQISPFKLPLSLEIQTGDSAIFDGLFGVFNDSLPDGWGRLLLDRALLKRGFSLGSISPLDRLSLLGRNGMEALSYQPVRELGLEISDFPDLDNLE